MIIFLDTNIFHNDWFMRNANFIYLFHFISNDNHKLYISNLVIEEVENNRQKELSSINSELQKNIKNIKKVLSVDFDFNIDKETKEEYDLLSLIEDKITDYSQIVSIPYDNILHKEVVQRALSNKKPFYQGEKGYRDTLIWLSFLEYLELNKIQEDIIFISSNKSDFFKKINKNEKNKTVEFSKELQEDITAKSLMCKIKPFNSLYSFVETMIDKSEHEIDYTNSSIDECLEIDGINYLVELPDEVIIELLFNHTQYGFKNLDIHPLDIDIELWEGLEDLEIIDTKKISNKEVFVQVRYNLRRVTIDLEISESDYYLNKNILDEMFYDPIIQYESVSLPCFIRPYFDASIIYNIQTKEFSNYDVNHLQFG